MTTQPSTGNRTGIWNGAARRRLPAIAGIGYTVAWVASLATGAPNPSVAASGGQVVAAFAGHGWSAMAMLMLQPEGIAAVALAIVVLVAARSALRQGGRRAGLTAASFGLAAAVVSWGELATGAALVIQNGACVREGSRMSSWSAGEGKFGTPFVRVAALPPLYRSVLLVRRPNA